MLIHRNNLNRGRAASDSCSVRKQNKPLKNDMLSFFHAATLCRYNVKQMTYN